MNITTQFDATLYRQTLGNFATGITVVTCRNATGAPLGITINSFTSVSLTPPLVLFCLSDRTRIYESFMATDHFAINILAAGQEHLSRHFSGAHAASWSDIVTQPSTDPHAPPLLTGCMGWLSCRRHAVHAGGDHMIIVGEVMALGHEATAQPLLYFRKQYRHI